MFGLVVVSYIIANFAPKPDNPQYIDNNTYAMSVLLVLSAAVSSFHLYSMEKFVRDQFLRTQYAGQVNFKLVN